MASSNPFEKLPAELITIILGSFECAKDVQSMICADPHILRVFLRNHSLVLRPLSQALYHHFPGKSLTQAVIASRLQQIENKLHCQNPVQAKELVEPILTSSPNPFSLTRFNLGALLELYQLHREADTCVAHYSKTAWKMPQHMAARQNEDNSVPLSETEIQQMQNACLLFDACRHTLFFSTSLLQDYGDDDDDDNEYLFHL
ncbi:hypothetical protein EDB82DRAFT_475431 [Fusarium venenatum]|uniref:uncharacterized protein n=1 Tax=Fusarium venenatum TaxID=56646 RepID=UPI001DA977E3|nr:hypothetical protein EDB82DRAFT_475431 [Fusarium venenatum]